MNKNYIEVYPIGTSVKIDETINATISGVLIRNNFIEYECQWVNNDSIENKWVVGVIIKPKEDIKKQKIGFNK